MIAKALSEIIPKEKGLVVSAHPGIALTNLVYNMYPSGIIGKLFNFGNQLSRPFIKNCR